MLNENSTWFLNIIFRRKTLNLDPLAWEGGSPTRAETRRGKSGREPRPQGPDGQKEHRSRAAVPQKEDLPPLTSAGWHKTDWKSYKRDLSGKQLTRLKKFKYYCFHNTFPSHALRRNPPPHFPSAGALHLTLRQGPCLGHTQQWAPTRQDGSFTLFSCLCTVLWKMSKKEPGTEPIASYLLLSASTSHRSELTFLLISSLGFLSICVLVLFYTYTYFINEIMCHT